MGSHVRGPSSWIQYTFSFWFPLCPRFRIHYSLQGIKITSEVIKDSHLGWSISYEELPQHYFSQIGEDGKTTVFFKHIEKHLLDHIEQYKIIVGCVAWLTNDTILKALAKKEG